MININQPLMNWNGYNYLNQSVEADVQGNNSRLSPTNNSKFGYINGEVRRTNSSIKINSESNEVVKSIKSKPKGVKAKVGRM